MIYAFLAIVSVFLQAITPVLNLPVLVVIWAAGTKVNAGKAYLLAFGTGLLGDLLLGNQLGVLAGAYLLFVLAVYLFKSRFPFNGWSLLIFLIVSQVIFFYARAFIG
ncbi:hypothetical protein M1403_03815 [Patescibacteria group bacterium]|nr:hypothetical protein [Patescibacteria group bacterium]